MSVAVGIDVGGTKIAGGLVYESGSIVKLRRIPTPSLDRVDRVNRLVESLLEEAASIDETIDAIGIGLPELVGLDGQVLSKSVADWGVLDRGVRCGIPIHVSSDVRSAGFAEAQFGAGTTFEQSFLYISIGTGVSGCLVLEGAPYFGDKGRAIVMSMAVTRGLGWDLQMVDTIGSGAAISDGYLKATGMAHNAKEVISRASSGDETALLVVREAGSAVGCSIAATVNFIDPQGVVIGGGLGQSRGIYWTALMDAIREGTLWPVPVVRGRHSATAGVIGAAHAARLSGESRGY